MNISTDKSKETNLEKVVFVPPLYIQRYLKVTELIDNFKPDENLRKVVDIGCGELSLFKYLKEMGRVEEVILFDLNLPLLKDRIRKVTPLPYDFFVRRKNPLTVSVVCGDATFLHPSFFNADVITMIEFIEHLQVDELPSIVNNIFGIVQPGLVIITTPNADYNKHFPGFQAGQFRHYDHKFEWTDKQFRTWCRDIVRKYEYYEVYFSGCGEDKDGMFCSQIGIFYHQKHVVNRLDSLLLSKNYGHTKVLSPCDGCMLPWKELTNCKILLSVVYPHDERSNEQICIDYIRGSVYDLLAWLRSHLVAPNFDFPFQVVYKHPHSYKDPDHLVKDFDRWTKGNEHLSPAISTPLDSLGGLQIIDESCESISNKFETYETLNNNVKVDESALLKHNRSLNASSKCEITDNTKLLKEEKKNEIENSEVYCGGGIFSEHIESSKIFEFVALDADFQESKFKDILKTNPCFKFYYVDSNQQVYFTSTTFCLWANLLAAEDLILRVKNEDCINNGCALRIRTGTMRQEKKCRHHINVEGKIQRGDLVCNNNNIKVTNKVDYLSGMFVENSEMLKSLRRLVNRCKDSW